MIKLGRAFKNTIGIEIDGAFYSCEYVRSPNRRYMLAWADSSQREDGPDAGGNRAPGKGPFVLLDDDNAVLSGELERPHDGFVANNGTFVLAERLSGEKPSSGFFAFSATGQKLLEVQLGAAIGDSGIASNGCFAVCQLMDSESDEANKLHCYDLTNGKLLWAREIETGAQRKRYKFDPVLQELHVTYYDGIGPLPYDLHSGAFLGHAEWRQQRIMRVEPHDICKLVDEEIAALEQISDNHERHSKGKELFDLLRRAFENCESHHQRAELCTALGRFYEAFERPDQAQQAYERAITCQPGDASAYQRLGEFFERRQQPALAIAAYEKACELDPEIGCKERLEALRNG